MNDGLIEIDTRRPRTRGEYDAAVLVNLGQLDLFGGTQAICVSTPYYIFSAANL
jgi:hypothetical protein